MPNEGQIARTQEDQETEVSTDLSLRQTEAELPSAEDDKHMVVLVRPGVGAKKYFVPQGSTVADLLEAANASSSGQDLMIGQDKVESDRVLGENTVLFVVPRPKNA
jgi:hypothetical protein